MPNFIASPRVDDTLAAVARRGEIRTGEATTGQPITGQLKLFVLPISPCAEPQNAAAACKSEPFRSSPSIITIAAPTKAADPTIACAAAYVIWRAIRASTNAA